MQKLIAQIWLGILIIVSISAITFGAIKGNPSAMLAAATIIILIIIGITLWAIAEIRDV